MCRSGLTRPGHDRRTYLARPATPAGFRALTGWQAEVPLDQTLADVLAGFSVEGAKGTWPVWPRGPDHLEGKAADG